MGANNKISIKNPPIINAGPVSYGRLAEKSVQ